METQHAEAPETRLHFLDYWRIIRIRKIVILTVFLLVVLTTTAITFLLKPVYSSTVRIAVEKEVTDVSSPIGNTTTLFGYDPFWLQTQFEKIQSKSVVYKVIERLGLQAEWSRRYTPDSPLTIDETCEFLLKRMKVRQARNTSLIEITFYSENKDEAAEIANVVADVYKESRLGQRREMKINGIKKLEDRLLENDKLVAAQKEKVVSIRNANNITEIGGDSPVPGTSSSTLHNQSLQLMDRLRVEASAEYVQNKTLFDKIQTIAPEDLKGVLPTALPYPDQRLVALYSDLAVAQQKLRAGLSDFGKENPEIKRLVAIVNELEGQVDDCVRGIVMGLQAKTEAAKSRLDDIDAKVKDAIAKEHELVAKYQPYLDAKREHEKVLQVSEALKLKIYQESVEADLPITTAVEIYDPATPALKPVKPNKPLNIGLGIVVGLMLGVGLAFFIEYLDTSVKTIDDVERTLQAAVLGVIPQNVGTLLNEGPESPQAEAYRVLRTNILFSRKDDSLNTITVVSGGVGEGKSTTLLNLATVFAQNNDRVLVVDSDLRRPSLHKVLKVSNSIGLTNYLLRQNTIEEVIQTTSMPGLDFMASGRLPSSSMGILSSEQMKNLILELKRRYDFVFFDSPPIMGISDASILASEVDMTLQVIQYRRYPQPMTIRAKQMIQKVGGNLIGIVLNNINMSQDESYYYYSGYYQDYYSPKQNDGDDVQSGKGDQAKLELKQKY
jgi:polysaccharide biosynthesis transport protein